MHDPNEIPPDEVLMPDDDTEDLPDEPLDYSRALVTIAPGNYRLRVVLAEYAASAPKENKRRKHMLKLELEIIGAYNPKHESDVGQHVSDYLVFTQSMLPRVARFAKDADVEAPRLANRASLEEFASAIIGAEISARITRQWWNGDARARVESYGPPTGKGAK